MEERLELNLTRTDIFAGHDLVKTTIGAGALGVQRLGDTTVNTVLLGQNLAFVTPGKSSVGGAYGLLGFEYRLRELVTFYANGEGTVMTDKSTTGTVRGGMRVGF